MIGEPDAGKPHVRFDEGSAGNVRHRGAPAPYSTEPRPSEAFFLTGPERGKRSALGRRIARAVAQRRRRCPRLPPEGETGKGANPIPCCRRLIAHAAGCRSRAGRHRSARCIEVPDPVRTIANRHLSTQMLVNRYRAARQRIAKRALVHLPHSISHRHCVVLGHHPLGLHPANQIQIRPPAAPKRRTFLRRRNRELRLNSAI